VIDPKPPGCLLILTTDQLQNDSGGTGEGDTHIMLVNATEYNELGGGV
jgi:hypothetical protein